MDQSTKKDSIMVKGYEKFGMGGIANVTGDYLQAKESASSDNRSSECSLDHCNKCKNQCIEDALA